MLGTGFFFFTNFLINCLSKYIFKIVHFKEHFKIVLKNHSFLYAVIFFLKKFSILKFDILTDINCIDFFGNVQRFELNYILLSLFNEFRLILSFSFSETVFIQSVTNIFCSANWMEREVWDMFGIFFFKHPDLRRILTDYGFDGYPFRKDFPLNGFFELRYSEPTQYLVYEPIEFMQAIRFYDFLNSFNKKFYENSN